MAESTKHLRAPASTSHPPSRSGTRHGRLILLDSLAEGEPYSEDSEDPDQPFLLGSRRPRPTRSWWFVTRSIRRQRSGPIYKFARRVFRHPLVPSRPITILPSLTILITSIVLLIVYIRWLLNPDKERQPWRPYCSIPSLQQPHAHLSPIHPFYPEIPAGETLPSFPPPHLEELPPAGVYIGVMTMDKAFQRRMVIRSTWLNHPRSRNGAGEGDGGRGTSRTVVRFILGRPKPEYEAAIKYEMETYKDLVILPIHENMNEGKMHTYFSWASRHAWVPPLSSTSDQQHARQFSYTNYTAPPPPLAAHDPPHANPEDPAKWVRPDFVLKADDDAFIMLAELEARLRVELHDNPPPIKDLTKVWPRDTTTHATRQLTNDDPLIHWGYMITAKQGQFMAGELYAFSWSLLDWIGSDPTVKTMTIGPEDQLASKWTLLHPRAERVRWASERCWIYDHPKAQSIYTHGFLFPSEVTRVKKEMSRYLEDAKRAWSLTRPPSANTTVNLEENMAELVKLYGPPKEASSRSTVADWHIRLPNGLRPYTPPVPGLDTPQAVEALVEGSRMSTLRPDGESTVREAWLSREGRKTRYEGKRVGGTVVVHYIKKHAWYLETALALLGGDEETELELQREDRL